MCSRSFETRSLPSSLTATSRLYLLCRFSQKLHSTCRFAHLCRSHPRGSIRAATHRGFAFYVAFPKRSIPSLATCSMSLISSAPLKLVRCPRSLAPTLVTLPSMSLTPSAPFASGPPFKMASHGVTSLPAHSKSSTKEQERSLDRQEENRRCGVNTEFHAEKRRCRGKIDVVICAELFDPVNNEFLNQVGAVSNARDERCAGNCNATQR